MAIEIISTMPQTWWVYCVLGLMAMAEGPFAILVGGAASFSGMLNPIPAYLAVCLGNLCADMGWYLLGRAGRYEWIVWLGNKGRIDAARLDELKESVKRHAPKMLFVAKLTVGLPIPTLVAAGLSRVPPRRWVGMLALGEMIKSAALIAVGYLYARTVGEASAAVETALWGVTAVVLVGLLVLWKRKGKARSEQPATDAKTRKPKNP